MFSVKFLPGMQTCSVGERQDLLSAALRAGISLRYGCRQGKCSSCKHWLVDGDVDDSAVSAYAISRGEREDGAILLCCTYPKSDLVVEIEHEYEDEEQSKVTPPSCRDATVLGVRKLTPSLVEFCVELDQPLEFRAGQYVEFAVGSNGDVRPYSIVNAPKSGRQLTFCVKQRPGGVFSNLLERLEPGAGMKLEGPFGTMFLRETGRPILAVAIGSGIAPILSILTDAANRGFNGPILFYYGARNAGDLVYRKEIEELRARLPLLRIYPCLSEGMNESVENCRSGRVTKAIAQDISDASPYDAYLCGAPPMCDAVGLLLEAKGMPESHIHEDRFFAAVDSEPMAAPATHNHIRSDG